MGHKIKNVNSNTKILKFKRKKILSICFVNDVNIYII